ncbi:hypothetical protein V8C86DRAFT_582165 [Haematococcus lacustris]
MGMGMGMGLSMGVSVPWAILQCVCLHVVWGCATWGCGSLGRHHDASAHLHQNPQLCPACIMQSEGSTSAPNHWSRTGWLTGWQVFSARSLMAVGICS